MLKVLPGVAKGAKQVVVFWLQLSIFDPLIISNREEVRMSIRIMPCLDMRDGRVVKGVHFVDIRDAG